MGAYDVMKGSAFLRVYKDGSILLTHGGIEMGQGLHTKMIQVFSKCIKKISPTNIYKIFYCMYHLSVYCNVFQGSGYCTKYISRLDTYQYKKIWMCIKSRKTRRNAGNEAFARMALHKAQATKQVKAVLFQSFLNYLSIFARATRPRTN